MNYMRLCKLIFGAIFYNHIFALIILSLFCYENLSSQINTNRNLAVELKKNEIPDSLINKDYKFLSQGFFKNFDDDSIAKIYVRSYIKLAHQQNRDDKFCRGTYLLSKKYNDSLKIELLDIAINIAKNKDFKRQPALSYFAKANYYFNNRMFALASDNYLYAIEDAKKKNYIRIVQESSFNLAIIKTRLNKYDEALPMFEDYLSYVIDLKKNNKEKYYQEDYLISLFAISETLTNLKKLDSASKTNRKALKIARDNDYNRLANLFLMNEGVNLFYKRRYQSAIDTLSSVVPKLDVKGDISNILYSNLYLGKSYYNQKKIKKAVHHFIKVDSLFQENSDFSPKIREAYTLLIDYFKKQNDLKNQLTYLNKLIVVDSVLNSNYIYISKNITANYDTPNLVNEKNDIIDKLNAKNEKFQIIIWLILFITLSSIFYAVKSLQNKKRLKKKVDILIQEAAKTRKEDNKYPVSLTNNDISDIPLTTVKRIENGLKEFELKKEFLQENITLNSLSKSFNTNPKYLSRTIYFLKSKRIIDYVNDLRIDYTLQQLSTDKKFSKYKVKVIAKEVGFSNPTSFSKAFERRIGEKPSVFIGKLKK